VEVRNIATDACRTVSTNKQGDYSITDLTPDTYHLGMRYELETLPYEENEAASVAASGGEPKKGGKKGATPKKVATQDDAFKGEEKLSAAIRGLHRVLGGGTQAVHPPGEASCHS